MGAYKIIRGISQNVPREFPFAESNTMIHSLIAVIAVIAVLIGPYIVAFLGVIPLSCVFGCVLGCVEACVSLIRPRPTVNSDQPNNAKETTPDAPPSYDELTVTTTVTT